MSNPSASHSPTPPAGAASATLVRLQSYLQSDPDNPHLRMDIFHAALQCGQWETAAAELEAGPPDPQFTPHWSLMASDYWLAQKNYAMARQVLENLGPKAGDPEGTTPPLTAAFAETVLHNLAYVDFAEGRHADCIQRLAPHVFPAEPPVVASAQAVTPSSPPSAGAAPLSANQIAIQRLWLRALHHARQYDRAIHWLQHAQAVGQLSLSAAGVGSLIALDHNLLALAQQWAQTAIGQAQPQDRPTEALVTQASLALARQDAPAAIQAASAALQFSPTDGRARSALAFAQLLSGQLHVAQTEFQVALQGLPEHIGTWQGLAWSQLLANELQAATTAFQRALALDPNFAESHGGLAVALALAQQTAAAQHHAQIALKLDPNTLSGAYAQALLNGDIRDAASLRQTARRILSRQTGPSGASLDRDILPSHPSAPAAP